MEEITSEMVEQIADDIMNWVNLNIENIEIIKPQRYARSIAYYLDKFLVYQEQLVPEDTGLRIVFDIVHETISKFLDRSLHRRLYEVFREARADILAMEMGGYEVIAYLNLQLTLIENEHMPHKEKDHKYFLRTACIISYAAQKELKKSNIILSESSLRQCIKSFESQCVDMVENRKSHMSKLFQFAHNYVVLVEPVVRYMRNSLKDKEWRLTDDNFGIDPNTLLLSCDESPNLQQQSEFYLNKWFELIKSNITGEI